MPSIEDLEVHNILGDHDELFNNFLSLYYTASNEPNEFRKKVNTSYYKPKKVNSLSTTIIHDGKWENDVAICQTMLKTMNDQVGDGNKFSLLI